MLKWFLRVILAAAFAVCLFGCKGVSGTDPLSSAGASAPVEPVSEAVSSADGEAAGSAEVFDQFFGALDGFAVQRREQETGSASVCIWCVGGPEELIKNQVIYPLAADMRNLLWISARGGAGISSDGWEDTAWDNAVIRESGSMTEKARETREYLSGSEYTWVRAGYLDDSPELLHGDILLYQDPENLQDAVLAVQDKEDAELWRMWALPGYGEWFAREVDLLFRLSKGY